MSFVQAFNETVGSQRSKVRDALASGKKLLREETHLDDEATLREKMDYLKDKSEAIATETGEKLTQFEQALPLAK